MGKKHFVDVSHRNVSSGQSRPIIILKKNGGKNESIDLSGTTTVTNNGFCVKNKFFLLDDGKRDKVGNCNKIFLGSEFVLLFIDLKYDFYGNTFVKTQCKKVLLDGKCRVIQIIVSLYKTY